MNLGYSAMLRGDLQRAADRFQLGIAVLERTGPQEYLAGAWTGSGDLFIRPGFEFRVVSALVTNFHLPRSSPLLLVSAFAGRQNVLSAYAHAVESGYRFYSYGDAMLVV